MMQRFSRFSRFIGWPPDTGVKIAVVTTNPNLPAGVARETILLAHDPDTLSTSEVSRFFGVLLRSGSNDTSVPRAIVLERDLDHVSDGDVLRLDPDRQRLRVLFQSQATHNSLLVTERCNSFCLMCSQPPRPIDDSYLIKEIQRTIELIPRVTPRLGLSGGEPTIVGGGFFDIIRHARNFLPETELHILTNGRSFKSYLMAERLAALDHPRLKLGIPLYSEQPDQHDFVVQAQGAFDETVKGLLNLNAVKVRVELRVVLHRHTYARLPELARFIVRNLPFVDYVALMGMELTGFAKVNLGNLWIDPYEYGQELAEAVGILERGGVSALIFNHQLCVVPKSVRGHCVKSISDWKNDYLPECDECHVKSQCGGFFSSGIGLAKHSEHINPILSNSSVRECA